MDPVQDQSFNPASETVPQTPAAEEKKSASYGSILGIIVIVAVLVVGAFYVWGERLKTVAPVVPEEGVRGDTMPTDASVEVEATVPTPN